jgi:hypothetical protein
MTRPVSPAAAVVLLAGLCAGCAENRNCGLAGTVSYQGKPVVYGSVIVQCADGTRSITAVQPDGSYSFDRLPAGVVKIAVASPEPPDPATAVAPSRAVPVRSAGSAPRRPPVDKSKWVKLPDELAEPETSGKTTTVSGPMTHFDIQLP